MLPPFFIRAVRTCGVAVLPLALLSACALGSGGARHYPTESFDSSTTHTRNFAATQAQTCEAARRALLSQGFFVSLSSDEQVSGRKQFQPAGEVHMDVEFRVVCASDQRRGGGSIAFATAVQDRYELKKSSNSASVGVGAIGSLSLPFNAGNDAMVKVASQTVTDDEFYARFFVLLDEFLYVPPAPAPEVSSKPAAPRAAAAAVPASPTPSPVQQAVPVVAPVPAPEASADAAAIPQATAVPSSSTVPAAAATSATPVDPMAPLPPAQPEVVPVPLSATRG